MLLSAFTALGSVLASSATASVITRQTTLPADARFNLMAIRSGSDVHYATFSAAKRSLFLRLPAQNATCDNGAADPGYATFYLKDGGLFLAGGAADQVQQLYTDRSGMGQGVLQYVTGEGAPIARNGEKTAFALDSVGDVTFNGAGFYACPNSIDGAWSIWVDAGDSTPGGNEGCLGIVVRAAQSTNPVECEYTTQ